MLQEVPDLASVSEAGAKGMIVDAGLEENVVEEGVEELPRWLVTAVSLPNDEETNKELSIDAVLELVNDDEGVSNSPLTIAVASTPEAAAEAAFIIINSAESPVTPSPSPRSSATASSLRMTSAPCPCALPCPLAWSESAGSERRNGRFSAASTGVGPR